MDKQQAISIIKNTFENPFDKDRFTLFTKNLLNRVEEAPFTYQGQFVPDAYKAYISSLERIGKFNDGENRIDILIIKLQKETSLERARTMQRNFVAWYLNGSRGGELKEAALVAFVSPDGEDWRFSLVKMDYKFEQTKSGRMKVKEEFTPARRWSFLVGANENSHTAQSRLVDILANDEHSPTLAELEQAFDIETVTKEFFKEYRELFIRTKEELDKVVKNDSKIKADFGAKGVNTVDFAKKLLGQIVFLYFLQKKGWFGVGRDAKWGTGSKHFLRELFKKEHSDYKNFFNDILEPLFYEALRIGEERKQDDYYYSRFNCKIPFLNGGLFDPIGNYDWVHTDILLPNELFSNREKTKEGDIGTGVFDVFDRYNFTVREDEPLEKEVAIDPEMLGKVFENLLEVKDRKSKGTYYTPREIVHYMCQESLINYLDVTINPPITTVKETAFTPNTPTQKKLFGDTESRQLCLTSEKYQPVVPREDIESFIRHGDIVIEHDVTAKEKHAEKSDYNGKYKKYKLPEGIRIHAKLIDDALADIKICDPAIGSGAFPVGMMHEIVRAKQILTTYLGDSGERTPYNFKRHAIQESLYGVDIDPGAVEIAKLRLWLSLVVDEEDYQTVKPLPNLDYKIVCGNSLLGVDKNLSNDQWFNELEKLKPQFFEETSSEKKKLVKAKIDALIKKITNNDEHFDFNIYFSEIFHQRDGFDIVIANPPYVRHEAIKSIKTHLAKEFGEFYCGAADLYTYFYKRGLDLLKPEGHLCFIAPNKFMRAGYGKNIRSLLVTQATPKVVIDFGDLPIFDATTYSSILLIRKCSPGIKDETITATFTNVTQLERLEETLDNISFVIPVAALKTERWGLKQPKILLLIEKLRKIGIPLGEYVKERFYRGITTGLNEAFVVNKDTRDRLISEHSSSAKLLKPFLRGRDLKRWQVDFANQYLIKLESSENKNHPWSGKSEKEAEKILANTYPAIHAHFEVFRNKLIKRDDQGKYFWELRSCIYWKEFEQPKIILGRFMNKASFAFDKESFFHNDALYMIPGANEYIVAILNSLCSWWFLSQICTDLQNGYLQAFKENLFQIPVPNVSIKQQIQIINIVELILTMVSNANYSESGEKQAKVKEYERQIDQMVYKLYDLTPEEIAIVEGKG